MKIFNFSTWALLLLLLVSGCKSKEMVQHFADAEVSYIRLDDTQGNDAEIEALIAPYREKMEAEMNVVVGSVGQDLVKARPNSSLGNWFSDLLEDSAKEIFQDSQVDFAIQNYGGLRLGSIPAGEITKGKIFELMPFDNTLVNVEMDQKTMQQFLDRIADYGGWPVSRSVSFSIQDSAAVDILINDQPLMDKNYYVAMPDYVANGGDNCYFLKDSRKEDSGMYIREIIIQHLLKLKTKGEDAKVDPADRIKIKN